MEEKTTTAGHAPGCLYCDVMKPMMQHFWSEATRDHFRASRVEFLKGVRSFIDHRIDHLSRPAETKGTHVNVE